MCFALGCLRRPLDSICRMRSAFFPSLQRGIKRKVQSRGLGSQGGQRHSVLFVFQALGRRWAGRDAACCLGIRCCPWPFCFGLLSYLLVGEIFLKILSSLPFSISYTQLPLQLFFSHLICPRVIPTQKCENDLV